MLFLDYVLIVNFRNNEMLLECPPKIGPAILLYLLKNKEIANRHARAVCFIKSENKMKRILQALVANGLLEAVSKRTRYTAAYQLTEAGIEAANQFT